MKTITIKREPGYFGMVRALEILMDGVKVGQLQQKESMELAVPDDAQVLQGKMDWGTTEPVNLRYVNDGQTVTFKAYFTLNPLKNFAIEGIPVRVTVE